MELGFEEGQASTGGCGHHGLQPRKDGNHQVDRAAVAVLVLAEGQPAAGMQGAQLLADTFGRTNVLPTRQSRSGGPTRPHGKASPGRFAIGGWKGCENQKIWTNVSHQNRRSQKWDTERRFIVENQIGENGLAIPAGI
jgi:hypothetical protein